MKGEQFAVNGRDLSKRRIERTYIEVFVGKSGLTRELTRRPPAHERDITFKGFDMQICCMNDPVATRRQIATASNGRVKPRELF